jgi:hypothetical protein
MTQKRGSNWAANEKNLALFVLLKIQPVAKCLVPLTRPFNSAICSNLGEKALRFQIPSIVKFIT